MKCNCSLDCAVTAAISRFRCTALHQTMAQRTAAGRAAAKSATQTIDEQPSSNAEIAAASDAAAAIALANRIADEDAKSLWSVQITRR